MQIRGADLLDSHGKATYIVAMPRCSAPTATTTPDRRGVFAAPVTR